MLKEFYSSILFRWVSERKLPTHLDLFLQLISGNESFGRVIWSELQPTGFKVFGKLCNVKPRHYEEFFTKASAQLINLQQLWINFQRLNENRVMQKCLFEIFKSKAGDISANPTMISIKIVSFICINSFWSNWWNYTFGHPLAKRWMRFIVYEKQDTNLILVESRFIIK